MSTKAADLVRSTLESKGHDTVSRVIGFRRDQPTLSATVIAEWVGVSPARASKILRDAGMPRQTHAENQRRRKAAKQDADRRAAESVSLSCPTQFASVARGLGLSIDETARLIGRDADTVRAYCRGRAVPKYILNFAYLALALGPERTRELISKGRTIAAGLVAKEQAKNLADPC